MFYGSLFQRIDTVVNTALLGNISAIMSFMNPIFRSMLVIYVAWWGISCILGVQGEPLKESFFRVFKIAVILTIALNLGIYGQLVKDFFLKGPEEISRIFLGSDSRSLDAVLEKGISVGSMIWKKAGTLDFSLNLISLIIIGATGAVTAFSAFLMLLSKIGIAIMVAVGPIFICLTIFESTKKYFEAWLSQAMNFFLLYVLLFIALGLFIDMYEAYVSSLNDNVGLAGVAQLVVFSSCFVLVLRQIPAIASVLGGGVLLSSLGGFGKATRGLMRTSRRLSSHAGGTLLSAKNYIGKSKAVDRAGKWISSAFRKRSGGAQ